MILFALNIKALFLDLTLPVQYFLLIFSPHILYFISYCLLEILV
jgi:hypothetical protein